MGTGKFFEKRDKSAQTQGFKNLSAVDRNGKTYNSEEMKEVFKLLYYKNPKAICLMFPDMTYKIVKDRAYVYGLTNKIPQWNDEDDATLMRLWPNTVALEATLGRSRKGILHRAKKIGISGQPPKPIAPEEYALIRKGLVPPGRSSNTAYKVRRRLGINLKNISSVAAITVDELNRRVNECFPRSASEHRRDDMVQGLLMECMAGRCSAEPADLAKAAKKIRTAVYKLHPDRGAHTSMDAQLFDDGTATVGDRIDSEAFHF